MSQKFCIYCGNELKPEWLICPQCGTPMRPPADKDQKVSEVDTQIKLRYFKKGYGINEPPRVITFNQMEIFKYIEKRFNEISETLKNLSEDVRELKIMVRK